MDKQRKQVFTTTELASFLGVSKQHVRNTAKKLGLGSRQGKSFLFSIEECNQIAKHLNRKLELDEESDDETSSEIERLKSIIQSKEREIDILRDQLDLAMETNRNLSAAIAGQNLLPEPAKKSRWKRLVEAWKG